MRPYRRIARSEEGSIKALLLLSIFIFAVYVGVQFGMPYYRYYAFQSKAKDIAILELGNVESIREKIVASANELKVPVEEKALSVVRKPKSVQITASWSDTVDIFGIYQKTLDFSFDIEE